MTPGGCKGKAHHREHLGYAGRRILVSRKWSGKTLADHRLDRKTWLLAILGFPATEEGRRGKWDRVDPGEHDHLPTGRRLLYVPADSARWQEALAEARRRAQEDAGNPSAAGRAA